MAWLAIAAAAGQQLYSQYQEGQTGLHKNDPDRFAQSAAKYYAAIDGDDIAACFLKYWGGRRGCAPGGCGGTPVCGQATQVAKDYNEACYQVFLKVQDGTLPLNTPAPPFPTSVEGGANLIANIISDIGKIAKTVSEVTGTVATATGNTPTTNTQQKVNDYLQAVPWILLLVGGGVLVYLLVRK